MANNTKIEYLDTTWNPLRVKGGGYHCTKIRSGCKHCWAEKRNMNPFFKWGNGKPFDSTPTEFEVYEKTLRALDHWKKRRRIGVQFMGDLFHEDIPFRLIEDVFGVMALAPQHTFFVLTKRVLRMADFIESSSHGLCVAGAIGDPVENLPPRTWRRVFHKQVVPGWPWPLSNVITGCSISNQPDADEFVPELLRIPGRHWVSVEPGLETIELTYNRFCRAMGWGPPNPPRRGTDPAEDLRRQVSWVLGKPGINPKINFVAMGGETGKGARPMYPPAARSMRDQCAAAGVPFHFKHWGEWMPIAGVYEERECPDQAGVIDGDWPLSEVEKHWGKEIIALEAGGYIPHWEKGNQDRIDCQPSPSAWWMVRVGRRKAGRLLDGREHNDLPEVK
jgi:protein gp37